MAAIQPIKSDEATDATLAIGSVLIWPGARLGRRPAAALRRVFHTQSRSNNWNQDAVWRL